MADLNITLNISECPQWTEDDLYIYDRFTFWFGIVGGLGVSIIGTGLNIIAIFVLISMKTRQNIFNHLLICLLCADSVFLLCGICFVVFDHLITSDRLYVQLVPVMSPVYWITLTLSTFLTVAISHERYIAIQYPIVHRQKMKSAKTRRINLLKYIIFIMFVAIVFHVPKFFELEVIWKNSTGVANETNLPIFQSSKYMRYFTTFENAAHKEQR